MNKRDDLIAIGAVVAGVTAGAVLAARRGRARNLAAATAERALAIAVRPPLALPAARRVEPAAPLVVVGAQPPAHRLPAYEAVLVPRAARRWRMPVAAGGLAVVLIGSAMVALALGNPHVTALAAPEVAYPGTTAVISYAAAGFGTISYRLDARSSRRGGALGAHEGAIDVPVAAGDANSDVVVVVRAAGPFGTDARVARIRVLERPRAAVITLPSDAVQIGALAVAAPTVASGDAIAVRYESNATSGSVLLRDVRGGLWQSKPISASGVTLLRAPLTDRDTPFNVVLQARRNGRTIENSVAMVVAGRPQAAGSSPGGGPGALAATATLDIPAVAQSGSVVVTSAGAGHTATVIELTGANGTELMRASPRSDGTTELRMPVVTAPQRYMVSVSYESGSGRETSFHWIRVLPGLAQPPADHIPTPR